MDRQKIKRGKTGAGTKRARRTARPAIQPWRTLVPYAFMGTVFVLGFMALLAVNNGALAVAGRIVLAAMILAGWEYYFRRYFAGPSSIEHEFSTLSDIFCFAVVPAFLIYKLAFRGWGMLGVVGLFMIIFGALIRLSLYKLYNPVTVKRGFIGIPVTITAAFISLMAQVLTPEAVVLEYRVAILGVITGLTFLTVSTIPYPNPADRPWIFGSAALLVGAIFLGPPVTLWAAGLLLFGGAVYIIIAPLGVKKGGRGHA